MELKHLCYILLFIFNNSQSAGVEFPPREANSVPFFTPPQTQPVAHLAGAEYDDAAIPASIQSDTSDLRCSLKLHYVPTLMIFSLFCGAYCLEF